MTAAPTPLKPPRVSPGRPREIEPWSNRLLVHRAAAFLLPWAARAGIAPNSITLLGLLLGLLAALAYSRWADPLWASAGFLLMIGWHIMDGLDGALARLTGRTSPFGRLLDGIADYATFVAVNIALIATLPDWRSALGLALASGAAHILQSLFYEAQRETYCRRIAGRFSATQRSAAGGLVERFYNLGEVWMGNRTGPLDRALGAAPPERRALLLARWRPRAAARLMLLSPLSANGRTIAIWLACLAGRPAAYWVWELVGLTALALAGGRALRQSEQTACSLAPA